MKPITIPYDQFVKGLPAHTELQIKRGEQGPVIRLFNHAGFRAQPAIQHFMSQQGKAINLVGLNASEAGALAFHLVKEDS